MNSYRALIEHRLQSWRDEKETNKHGMAKFADRAIRLLEIELAHPNRSNR